MSKGRALRALVSERLAAAAEDIFVLFERTITEYEEELSRSKEENQRNQQLLDKMLSPRMELVRVNVHSPSTSPDLSLNHKATETPGIKEEPEEQSVKQEEDRLLVSVPESSGVCVKTEESLLLHQRQTEHQKGAQEDDASSEPHFLSETEGLAQHYPDDDEDDDDWRNPFHSATQTETPADGDHYTQVQMRDRSIKLFPQNRFEPETTVHSGHVSGAEGKKHQCPFCQKIFGSKQRLQTHMRVHTGERPYSCSSCDKTFALKSSLDLHRRTHTGEKPYSCLSCKKHFADPSSLRRHKRVHTGEKPYSCLICLKTFAQKSALNLHIRTHTGDKPYSCTVCGKTFARKNALDTHSRTHSGDRPHRCFICSKQFANLTSLRRHVSRHTGERFYSCSVCEEVFTQKAHLDFHARAHSGDAPETQPSLN